jgi:hypothetical protein
MRTSLAGLPAAQRLLDSTVIITTTTRDAQKFNIAETANPQPAADLDSHPKAAQTTIAAQKKRVTAATRAAFR